VELPRRGCPTPELVVIPVTKTKAAAILEAATGREVPRLEAQGAGKAGGWLSAPPLAG